MQKERVMQFTTWGPALLQVGLLQEVPEQKEAAMIYLHQSESAESYR